MKKNKIGNVLKSIYQFFEYVWYMIIKRDSVAYTKKLGVRMGSGCHVLANPLKAFGTEPWLIKIGNHVEITTGVRFLCHEGAIWVTRYKYNRNEEMDSFAPITIGNNVFIGFNSIIMPGVTIGDNVIIGAQSVVTRNVPDNTIFAGIPAKQISSIDIFVDKYNQSNKLYPTKNMTASEKKVYLKKVHPEWFD